MAKKATAKVQAGNGTKANFKAQAEAKARKSQEARLDFISKFGKQIAASWAKLERPNVMAVAVALKQPARLVDYVTVSLGLRNSKDKGLEAWVKADKAMPALSAACPAPKRARKVTKEAHEASVQV